MSREPSQQQTTEPAQIEEPSRPPRRKDPAEFYQSTVALLEETCRDPASGSDEIRHAKVLLTMIDLKIRLGRTEDAMQSREKKQIGSSNRIEEAMTERIQHLEVKMDEKLEHQDQAFKNRMEQLERNYDPLDSSLRSVIDTNIEVVRNLKAEAQKELRELADSKQDGKRIRVELKETTSKESQRLEKMMEDSQGLVMFLVVVGVLLVSFVMSDY